MVFAHKGGRPSVQAVALAADRIRLGEAEVHSALGYYLVLPERKRRQRLTARFVDWLQAELDSSAASV